jgi:transcriptional antiterminator NusG
MIELDENNLGPVDEYPPDDSGEDKLEEATLDLTPLPVDQAAEELIPAGLQEGSELGVEDGRAWYVVHCYSGYENKVRPSNSASKAWG